MTLILAISGSLRAATSNTALLRAAGALAPDGVEVVLYGGLADLPLLNPDRDDFARETAPPEAADLRSRLEASDGLIISSSEYAHAMPGALKSALDWVVSSGEIYQKVGPGETVFTRMPWGPNSSESALVRLFMPAFAAP
ncbi:MAG TPA: NADPH-dependent FMN reductase [Rubrobacteraceae bacterium]|nr:NADPH-dependent FMN reductase [Rubrobacteraceae bacterium]